MADVPKPPETPKETPHSHGRYAQYDDRALWEHTADKVQEMIGVVARHDSTIARHDLALEQTIPKIDLVLRPRPVSPVTQAIVAACAVLGTVALLAIAFAAVTVARTPSASAAAPTQAIR